jgi:uncharacterized membrane protein
MALLTAPFIYLAAQWDKFPALIPIHWNVHGQIDNWASKPAGLLMLPLVNVGLGALFRFLPFIDPKVRRSTGEERARAAAVLRIVRAVMLLFMSGIFWVQMAISRGYPVRMNAFALNGCLLVFIVIGNYSAKLRPNYFTGIRTPWTLENPETWRATHRIGGRILVFGSLLLIATEFFIPSQTFAYAFVAFVLAFTAWAFLFSWNHCRTHPASQ